MSKVLIDRALLERVQERLDPHRDAVLWGAVCDTFHTAPSGTPAMPVKAYYYEAPNEYGGFNKSVGLEVRKKFADAPMVLESDALARIACLEGEIAKRDEELAACRVAVENCEVFRARIAELEARIVWLECEAQGEYGDAYQGAREDLAIWRRRALEAEKALQEERIITERLGNALNEENGPTFMGEPVFPAKAQGVVMPPSPYMPGSQPTDFTDYELGEIHGRIAMWEEVKRLNAAPVQQVSVPDGWNDGYRAAMNSAASGARQLYVQHCHHHGDNGLLDRCKELEQSFIRDAEAMLAAAPAAPAADVGAVLEQAMYTLISIGYHENSGLVHELRQALAAHRAKGVVS